MKSYRIILLTFLLLTSMGASRLFAQTGATNKSAVVKGEVKTKLVLT